MGTRTKLTLLFSLLAGSLLVIFAFFIYASSASDRRNEFFNHLKKEGITRANVLFDAGVDAQTLQTIYLKNREVLSEVEVAIYDLGFNLLYHDAVDIDFVKETPEMIDEIANYGQISFMQDGWNVTGFVFPWQGNSYVITAAAYDEYGYAKLQNLRNTLIISCLLAVALVFLAGTFFSRRVFRPVSLMVEKVSTISASNLHLRLVEDQTRDEISRLANTFNSMLSRLENSFEAQRGFVSNISHELRTPLSAIITELELALSKEKGISEYRTAIKNSLNDARKLVRLSNSLLDMAKASYDPTEINFKPLRIDEIILDARRQALRSNPEYSIDIRFIKDPEDEEKLTVNGNEYLLTVAFSNLLDNGCKFSADKKCMVSIDFDETGVLVKFSDNGVGISNEDIESIFTPFFRGSNKSFSYGNGIGLSLTQKIISLHKGNITVSSKINKGSTFSVSIPFQPL